MKKLIVASNSPRRQELMRQAGFEFDVFTLDVDEAVEEAMPAMDVALFLAQKKNKAYRQQLASEVVLTADTVVVCDGEMLGKPKNAEDARRMLRMLCGGVHEVVSGVCISSADRQVAFDDTTHVYFKAVSDQEIDYYIDSYRPFDKAGAYGIQEWIGMIAIDKIEGSYYNVVGLPIHKVYAQLRDTFGITPLKLVN